MIAKSTLQNFLIGFFLLALAFFSKSSIAQTGDSLNKLSGSNSEVLYSKGAEEKANRLVKQLDKVIPFYTNIFHFTPKVTVLLLAPADWSRYTKFPFYGMPHYNDNKTLVIASEDNEFWRNSVPDLDKLPEAEASRFKEVYSDKKGGICMEPFFDLLALHELGHAYHNQGGLLMQRRWMGELFSNILLHTYIAENEPGLLPVLTVFPRVFVAGTDKSDLKYTTLQELETYYNDLGKNYPQNYAWYQCRWHMAAADIYDQSKTEGIKNLWTALKNQQEKLSDQDFAALLKTKVHPSVAELMLGWGLVIRY